ncbi:MAG: diaminopimelate decarboxylase [Oligoflexus sp.]
MDHFHYRDGQAYCEDLSLESLAEEYGTPLYVYSRATLQRHLQRVKESFSIYPTVPCFAVKANSNLSILRDVFRSGFGADVVSGGELERALLAGVDPKKIVYSGVGKRHDEIKAALTAGIMSFNVESSFELAMIEEVAASLKLRAPISLRINPNIDAKTNPKIATGLYSTKFGMSEGEARSLVEGLNQYPHIELVGIACHIGSQITSLQPLGEAAARMAQLAIDWQESGLKLKYLNMGGGLGIRYRDETPPEIEEYAETLLQSVRKTGLTLAIEPGRVILGNVGVLLTRVIGVKTTPQKNFLIVDGAMNDLIRPSMYDSYHNILPVREAKDQAVQDYDVVGPICETGDLFGKDRRLPLQKQNDLVFLRACGAYGSTMASNYNSRPRPAEVLVDGQQSYLIKPRESLEQLWWGEQIDIPEVIGNAKHS